MRGLPSARLPSARPRPGRALVGHAAPGAAPAHAPPSPPLCRRRIYNSPCGIYAPGCGLSSVYMRWSAAEYLHMVLVLNRCAAGGACGWRAGRCWGWRWRCALGPSQVWLRARGCGCQCGPCAPRSCTRPRPAHPRHPRHPLPRRSALALPDAALFMIRHHKFASLTRPNSPYTQLLSEEELPLLPLLREFQQVRAGGWAGAGAGQVASSC